MSSEGLALTPTSLPSKPSRADFHQVNPVQTYRRRPPRIFNATSLDEELLAWYYKNITQLCANCAEEGFFLIKDCHVYEGSFVLKQDMYWLDESVIDYRHKSGVLPTVINVIQNRFAKRLAVKYTDRPNVLISSGGYQNHGHCLTDILPKLVNVGRTGLKSINLLIPGRIAYFSNMIVDICHYIGFSVDIIICPDASLFSCDEIMYFSPVSVHVPTLSGPPTKSPVLIEFVDVIRARYKFPPNPLRKLFVGRPDTEPRHIENHRGVTTALADLGYDVFFPGQRSLLDQVQTFSQASHIVAPLGAGLANSIFSSPSAKIMMLDPGLADFYFWDVASLFGQEFYWVFTDEIERWSEARASNAFLVQQDVLRTALRFFEQ